MNQFLKLLIIGLSAISLQVAAQSYPAANITLVVPFAPGSGTDAVARIMATKMGSILGQPVIVDNKPGASAQIGAQFVASAKPTSVDLLSAFSFKLNNL